MANIKDVARLAGVSVGTVSRYMNGADIKEINRINIQNAVDELNFKLNPIARGLKTSKSFTVGVVIPNFEDIYSTTLLRNIENTLFNCGYYIFACDCSLGSEQEKKKVQLLFDRMVDGLIIFPSSDLSYMKIINTRNVPIVTIDTAISGYICDQVVIDNVQAVYTATKWLIDQNHRDIAFIGPKRDRFTSIERIKGFERAMEDYFIDYPKEFLIEDGFDENVGYNSVKRLLSMKRPPTAIIASNYYTTIGAIKAFYDMNIKIPDEVSFIGFDNLGLSEIVRPKLTIITQPMELMGKTAAELLLKRLNGEKDGYPSMTRLMAGMTIRESTRGL